MSSWSEEENGALLKIWGEDDILAEFDGTRRNGRLYRMISDRMKAVGYDRSPEQCQSKLKWFKYEYKASELRLRPSDTTKTFYKYYDEIDNILNRKKLLGRYPEVKYRSAQVAPTMNTLLNKSHTEVESTSSQSPRSSSSSEDEARDSIRSRIGADDSETDIIDNLSDSTNDSLNEENFKEARKPSVISHKRKNLSPIGEDKNLSCDDSNAAKKQKTDNKKSRVDIAIEIMKKVLQNQQETVDSLAEEEVAVIEEAANEIVDCDEKWRQEEREHQMKLLHMMIQMIAQLFGRSVPPLTQLPDFLNFQNFCQERSSNVSGKVSASSGHTSKS